MGRPRVATPAMAASLLALAVSLCSPAPSFAQGHTPDPFNGVGDYNGKYEPYLYPSYPSGYGFYPGQGRLGDNVGVRSANRFQDYLEDLDGGGLESGGLSSRARRYAGIGAQYYRSFRQYDHEFGREYVPNQAADKAYDKSRQERDDVYFRYIRAKDPKVRAELQKQLAELSRRVSRDLNGTRSVAASSRAEAGRRSPGAPASGTRARSSSAPPPPGRDSTSAGRSTRHAPPPPSAGRPSDVLRRSLEMDRGSRRPPAAARPRPSSELPPIPPDSAPRP